MAQHLRVQRGRWGEGCAGLACRFSDKTRNEWEDRASFVKHEGKYDLLALDYTVKVWRGEGRGED